MSNRKIVVLPNPALRKVCEPIPCVNDEIRELASEMLEIMYAHEGIGLAANQIGLLKRLIVVDVSTEEGSNNPIVLVNPEITWQSEETSIANEGCLSLPDCREEIQRPDKVTVKYQDLDGNSQEIAADELLARCLQHEIDHLNGRLIIDYLSKLKRELITKKYAKLAKQAAANQQNEVG